MITAAALALILGACLLIAGATALALKAGENHELRVIERTALMPVGALRTGPRRVAAAGVTSCGPGGPVVAPVSGIECAWFAVQLIRIPTRRADAEEPGQDVLLELAAPMPPALTDGTGSVLIDPRLLAGYPNPAPNLRDPVVTDSTMRLLYRQAAATAPAFVPRELIEDIRSHETLQLWETRLAAGREVYLLGTPARTSGSLVLRPTSSGFTVFTPDARQTVIDRRREQAASSRGLAVGLSCAGVVVTALSSAVLYLVT